MRHAPLWVGTLLMLCTAAVVVYRHPSPGALAAGHAALEGKLESCTVCHAEGGLDAGCLACHDEIGKQLADGRGYHHTVCGNVSPTGRGAPDCARCHPEHHGRSFDTMEAVAWPEREFRHEHVEFTLHGAHDSLECDQCHTSRGYLGLEQGCVSCHDDVHEGSLYTDCLRCHDQQKFSPTAGFDHGAHFPLAGAHADTSCKGCHVLDQGLTYHKVRGKTCRECHENPHRTDWKRDCEACHRAEEPAWKGAAARFTADLHQTTGFPLGKPHDKVACEGCHTKDPRFSDRKQDDCAACHADVHAGQFGKRTCRDCHERTHFTPVAFSHEIYPLEDAHAKVECKACHTGKPQRFAKTPRACAACHDDPHAGQFKQAACDACHDTKAFQPPRYGLDCHLSFPLTGAHQAVACVSCHTGTPRRFVGTPRSCRECHADPHGKQFGKKDCTSCHRRDAATFRIRPYKHKRYTLEGAHATADCKACHTGKTQRFAGTPTRCDACHTDTHRGQLAPRRCDSCHATGRDWRIRNFDHDRLTRFPLDKTHNTVACSACHPSAKQRDGASVVQFRPVGKRCGDCHAFKSR